MAVQTISRLIQESQDALEVNDFTRAKQTAFQAVADINIEKCKFLTGVRTNIDEQQFGDWYGGCSFVMHKIGENFEATRCFYTAIIFDSTWNIHNHKKVFDVLWNSLVFSRKKCDLSMQYEKELRWLLAKIDDLAKLAESRGKCNVCVTIDGDIKQIFSYLMQCGIVEHELIKQPGRRASLWRSARCFLRMGMHEDARKLCSTILQHACNYDDSEAFEIWARSFHDTNNFDIALEKCDLAIYYCKEHGNKQRLEALRLDIQKQIAANVQSAHHGEETNSNEDCDTLKKDKDITIQHDQAVLDDEKLSNQGAKQTFCVQHTENPVLYLYRYSKTETCDKYPNVQSYLERWIPVILMEAATGAVRNDQSFCINDVTIEFLDDRKGRFSLDLDKCEANNIELSEDCDGISTSKSKRSYEWLCLKATSQNIKESATCKRTPSLNEYETEWIGHAKVIKIVKRKDLQNEKGGIIITFKLHEKSEVPPVNLDVNFCVEILKKLEIDRRTECFIRELPCQCESLAAKIALNIRIPDLDRSRAHIASLRHNQDLYFKNLDDPQQRKTGLPLNNIKQQEAINKALTSRFSLIQGPPGTGKIYTAIKLVYLFDRINFQMSKEGHPKKQVLYCSHSNELTDLVAFIMLTRMGSCKPNFIRVYDRQIEELDFPIPGKTVHSRSSTRSASEDLRCVALHHLIREKGKNYAEEILAKDKFFKDNNYKYIPKTVKEYVHTVREVSIEEIKKYDVILCTTNVCIKQEVIKTLDVYQIIIDDAAMCTEPQALATIIATKAEHVVLIGDHKQLRPVVKCREAALLGLEKSLFERYATTESSKNVPFTRLSDQYRMNPEICRLPSKHFYESALRTMRGTWGEDSLHIWPKDAKGNTYPHVLIHIEGGEHMVTLSIIGNVQSWRNDAEINHVIATFLYLTKEVPNETVQILTQYDAQCSEIKRRLEGNGITTANDIVSTVNSSQECECSYVIFSTVRSLPECKIINNPTPEWCQRNLGLINDMNQVNVALTRARKGLIIIGNRNLLACDCTWKKLIQHYEVRGCIKTPEEFPPQNIRRSRREIMREAILKSHQRYDKKK
ncbi:helicase with zinc finger domain 2-like isoform X2 [Ruditapes philippinarum]|uniref:helicase with zinc finger domain 2-like isoform X2 n=1 Tax=Ruditapes philippinarum TaxID=129788 RepID=UPI00295BC551|nr:helicase with zinc finger domain 2-like isoform X2 [Ruditapes philippinarum]